MTGVEPHNDVVGTLMGTRTVDGAATVVLESAAHAAGRGARVRAMWRGHDRGPDLAGVLRSAAGLRTEPIGSAGPPGDAATRRDHEPATTGDKRD